MTPIRDTEKGIVTIPVLIGFMALILLSSIAIGSVSFNQLNITQISNDGARALVYAEAGAKDAMQRIPRDMSYTTSGATYDLAVADLADCSVSLNGCATIRMDGTISPKIITVIGYSGSAQRKIQVDVPYDSSYKIINTFWNEIKNLPTISTGAATSIGTTTATLNGWSNPNGNSVTGWFRYSPTEPENCSDNFGLRQPTSGGDSLSGTDPVSFSEDLTDLTAGGTYYYCAIGSDGGTPATKVYGQVFSFTATGSLIGGPLGLLPTVTTSPATDISDAFGSFNVTLNGSASPNGFSTTGWFRYSESNPVVCNTTFGNRAPSSGGTSLGAGGTAVAYDEDVVLNPETEYFFCALASNSFGTGFGLIESFTTPAAFSSGMAFTTTSGDPDLSIYKRSSDNFVRVASDGVPGSGYSSDFSNDDKYLVVPSSAAPFISLYKRSGDTFTKIENAFDSNPTSITRSAKFSPDDKYLALGYSTGFAIYKNNRNDTFTRLTSLTPGAESVAFSSSGDYLAVTQGAGVAIYKNNRNDTFTKISAITVSGLAKGVAFSSNTDNEYLAIAHTGGDFLTIYKRSGETFGLLPVGDGLSAPPPSAGFGVAFSKDDYHLAFTQSFGELPYVTVYSRSDDDFTKLADLPDLLDSKTRKVSFSIDDPYYLAIAYDESPYLVIYKYSGGPSGSFSKVSSDTPPTNPDALPQGAGYHSAFTKLPASATSPKTFTYAASSVFVTEATLNGAARPMGYATTGWFRYSTADPGTCNDTFGDRAPSSGGTSLGLGVSTVEYSQVITGLTPATLYYFCAISSNTIGTTFGKVLSFTTIPLP